MAICKSCEKTITWAETPAGKPMPLDAEPSPRGTMALVGGKCWHATEEDRRLLRPLFVPHWATCPDAPSFRRRNP